MLYFDAICAQLAPTPPGLGAGLVRIVVSTKPRLSLPACSCVSSAVVEVNDSSFTVATWAFWGPEYFVLGTNVAFPSESKAVSFHGPSSALCHSASV